MSNELQILNPDVQPVDMFFDREPVVTDWDGVKHCVEAGEITSAGVLERLKTYEPLAEADSRDHAHWIDQQTLRLALLHEAGKPMDGKNICESCGLRKTDPLRDERSWRNVCLYCAEADRQAFEERGRGSCEFLKACYNPRSRSWGLLYYWSHGRDHTFIFWLADFYRTRQEAERAVWPIRYYHQWLRVRTNDMIAHWLSFTGLLPISEIMKLSLPMTPDKFRAHLRSVIEADMGKEQPLMRYYVEEAMKAHESKEHDE